MQHDAGETWPTPASPYRNPPPAQQPRDSYPANASLLPGLPFGSHGNNFTMAREFLKKKLIYLHIFIENGSFIAETWSRVREVDLESP